MPWVVVGAAIVVVGPSPRGTGGAILSVIGALVTLYGVWPVWKSRPSGGG